MRHFSWLLAAAGLLMCGPALTQTASTFQSGASISSSAVNSMFGAKCDTLASACTVQPSNATAAFSLSSLVGSTYVEPDWFKLAADGTDDAPAIRRAQAIGMPLRFRCRHYAISSASTFTNRLQWQGCGVTMLSGSQFSTSAGTWLDVDASFKSGGSNANAVPFTIQTAPATGSVIDGFGVSEVQPYPASNATSWTPNSYNYLFVVQNTAGEVTFRNTFWPGVTYGIRAVNSGRLTIKDMRGQFFNNAVFIDMSYDVSRIMDLHVWPYWADNVAVEQYQQANLDTVTLGRSDTQFIARMFSYGARSGIRFTNINNGVVTGGDFHSISCDFVQYCLWADSSASGVAFQAGSVRSFGQKIAASGTAVSMLANSSVIQADGQISSAQIGSIVNYGTSTATISLANGNSVSVLHVGAISVQNVQYASASSQMVSLNGNGSNIVYLAMPPQTIGTPPSGYTYTNGTAGGGLFTPTYSKLAGGP